MQLNELKKSMSTLEQILARTSTDIKIDVSASQTAQARLLRKYRHNITLCAILAIVFGCLWIGSVSPEKLPDFYKAFIAIITAIASVWYIFLYTRLNQIDIASCSPAALLRKTSSFKILNLTGEIVLGICSVVLLTLYLRFFWFNNNIAFWAAVITTSIGIALSAIFLLPKYIKLFHDLNSIKE